jgi:hypothetical protein
MVDTSDRTDHLNGKEVTVSIDKIVVV